MEIVFSTPHKKEKKGLGKGNRSKDTKAGTNQVNWNKVRLNPVPHNPEAIRALTNAMYKRRVGEVPLEYRAYIRMWCSFWRDMIIEALNGDSTAKSRIMKDEWVWRALNSMIGMNGDYIRKIMVDYYRLKG